MYVVQRGDYLNVCYNDFTGAVWLEKFSID